MALHSEKIFQKPITTKKEEKAHLKWLMLIDNSDHLVNPNLEYYQEKFKNKKCRVYFKPQIETEPYSEIKIKGNDYEDILITGGSNLKCPDEGDSFLVPMNSGKLGVYIVKKVDVKTNSGFIVNGAFLGYSKRFASDKLTWFKNQFFTSAVHLYNGN